MAPCDVIYRWPYGDFAQLAPVLPSPYVLTMLNPLSVTVKVMFVWSRPKSEWIFTMYSMRLATSSVWRLFNSQYLLQCHHTEHCLTWAKLLAQCLAEHDSAWRWQTKCYKLWKLVSQQSNSNSLITDKLIVSDFTFVHMSPPRLLTGLPSLIRTIPSFQVDDDKAKNRCAMKQQVSDCLWP